MTDLLRRRPGAGLAAVVVLLALLPRPALAQPDNPVYIDDSPRAWELFQRAQDQGGDNAGEAVRLYQELLDDYTNKLLPLHDGVDDHLVSVRARVLDELRQGGDVLERYRLTQNAEAERLLARGDLQRLALTRSMTRPGLEAMLRLAQEHVERAGFRTALRWLDEAIVHPDIEGRDAAHAQYLRAMCAYYMTDDTLLREAQTALNGMSGRDATSCQDALRDVLRSARRPSRANGQTTLDRTSAEAIDRIVDYPIWQVGVGAGAPSGQETVIFGRNELQGPPDRTNRPTAIPTVTDTHVFLHDGSFVRCVDRFTGRTVWPLAEDQMQRTEQQASESSQEMNVVAVDRGSVVAIAGRRRAGRLRTGQRLVCLDQATGATRWDVTVAGLGGLDEHEELEPFGRPVIGEDLVYILARKGTKQLLTSCYVLALDLADGSLAWSRHVASVGSTRRQDARYLPYSQLVEHDGDIIVASSIGAVGRFDGASGLTSWLRRYSAPLMFTNRSRQRWDVHGPVITPRGVLSLQFGQSRVVLHDLETGDELESHDARRRDTFNTPRYLLADDRFVYAVGRDIRAFSINNLRQPIWRVPGEDDAERDRQGIDLTHLDLRGRVQLIDGALVIPTAETMLLVDNETGRLIQSLDLEITGNPLVAGSQLLVANPASLRAYMPFDRAESILRQRLASQPTVAAPALSLLQMASRARNMELALEAAGLALDAIHAAPADVTSRANQNELSRMLIDLDGKRIGGTVEQGEALHALIGTVAANPEQHVEHLLAYGAWLSDQPESLGAAVRTYQQILVTEILAQATLTDETRQRPAQHVATERLAALIDEFGPQTYAAEADFAATRLEQLRASGAPALSDLLKLGAEYPFADAAVEATMEAAARAATEGDSRAATAALLALYQAAPSRDRAAVLLGRVADIAADAGWAGNLRRLTALAGERFPGIELETRDGARDAVTWSEDQPDAARYRRPAFGTLRGEAVKIRGAVVPALAAAHPLPPDQLLLRDGATLSLYTSTDLAAELAPDVGPEAVWSTDLSDPSPQILAFTHDRLLLWLASDLADPRVVQLDTTTGEISWQSPAFREVVDQAGEGLQPLRGVDREMPDGGPFRADEILPLASGDRVILARRTGDIIACDLDGDEGWTARDVMRRVHHVALQDDLLVIAGRDWFESPDGSGDRTLAPALMVLDPETGETLRRTRAMGEAGVLWMFVSPLGDVVYGTAEGVRAVDLYTGLTRWTTFDAGARRSRRAWPAEGHVVIEDHSGSLRSVRISDGWLSEAFEVPLDSDWTRLDPLGAVVAHRRLYARYKERIVCFDAAGRLLGADVVTGTRDYKALLPAGDRLALINLWKSEQRARRQRSGRRTEFTYHLYLATRNCKLEGDPYELEPVEQRLTRASVMDGFLLLSFDVAPRPWTIAVPAP